jgi:hypothetical protein
MSLPFGGTTVTLVRRTVSGTDAHGEDVYTLTREDVAGCQVQPVSSAEQLGTGDTVTTRYRLFAPAGVDLDAVDAVEVDGRSYEVDGETSRWSDLLGVPHHVEAFLRRVTG